MGGREAPRCDAQAAHANGRKLILDASLRPTPDAQHVLQQSPSFISYHHGPRLQTRKRLISCRSRPADLTSSTQSFAPAAFIASCATPSPGPPSPNLTQRDPAGPHAVPRLNSHIGIGRGLDMLGRLQDVVQQLQPI